jgi:hypothetical protein
MLKELAGRLDQHHAFAKGQFVVWRAGLKNKLRPDYGAPAIVTGVYPSPQRAIPPAPTSWSRFRSSARGRPL